MLQKAINIRIITLIFTLLLCHHTSALKIYAFDEFHVDTTASYLIDPSGNTNVTHNIKLINKLPNIYATQYAMSMASTRIKNVWSKDNISELSPKVSTTSNSTNISLEFKHLSVGLDQVMNFFIGYEDEDITQQIGRVWEINIPKPENINEYRSYNVVLSVPNAFTNPVQIIPTPKDIVRDEKITKYMFEKNDLMESGITALFGEKQVFSFDLRYTLNNTSPISKNMQISLPPDTAYQRVTYEAITPTPDDMFIDGDGNWLAVYSMKSREKIEIHAVGNVILFIEPDDALVTRSSNFDSYLKEAAPWPVEDAEIINLARKLNSPENIYNYVVKNLSYNYERIEKESKRLGAKQTLLQPDQAMCMEFTDLFITLCRAAGIPARELNGFAYTQNPNLRPLSLKQDVLHAWPEYYDFHKQRWIQVDPTWGNTTQGIDYFSRFDLNHFVFVIHGKSYQTPYPPGFYRSEHYEGKDITINPNNLDPQINDAVEATFNLNHKISAGFKKSGFLKIINRGNSALHQANVSFSGNNLSVIRPEAEQQVTILPFTTKILPFSVKADDLFKTRFASITVKVNNDTYEQTVEVENLTSQIPQIILALGLGALFAFYSSKSGGIFISFLRKRSSLRWKSQKT